jgi:hypothetical protein
LGYYGKSIDNSNSVSYYEKIKGTYFEGDFSVSQWLGTDLDYSKIQNLLVGKHLMI